MSKNLQDTTTLHNGVKMPWFGIGVFKVEEGPELVNAVKFAIQHGYRSIDTAAIYGNEEGVGQGICKTAWSLFPNQRKNIELSSMRPYLISN